MRVEYLVTIEITNSFCKTKKSFLNFIQSDSEINIVGKKINYKSDVFGIEITEENSPSEKNKIFHIKLSNENDEKVNEFTNLLKVLRNLLHMASKNNIQTLWDDIGFNYSLKCYPIIHEIENMMRKLITKFMLTNVGVGWVETAIPEELKKSKRAKSSVNESNYLYDTDFIQLSNFLFDTYRTQDIESLISKIKSHKEKSINSDELKDFIPQSNWQRYFQKHVECEGSYLKSKWEKLYLLRCKVAHNKNFDKIDYDSTFEITNEIRPILEDAIASLDKITVPEDEREELAENVVINNSEHYGDFIVLWKKLESKISEAAYKNGTSISKFPFFARPEKELHSANIISEDILKSISQLREVRNIIVHNSNKDFSIDDLVFYNQQIKSIINII
ncbi:HEPN domain-containing protein [Serratia plymuthica]|uniref:Apea-like HEPN domain-containing protein n=1 Tax=Serratia plymuthica TaxID=82996 RepID=A0A7T2SWN4_SERPL|nr:HEPN domain-containing protein [Serratia plymuthica]QPS23044.1 hypothetical protein I6G64_12070 [Serratia plymuthica]QPS64652.1 hypothetical protein I6G52_07865 [Serratia plymuthica]RKS62914.1 hypothetical protein C8E17_2127 [Serratia plymuthica]CAI2493837.1 Uncharacterised protein [Serratia plymuthica]